MDLGRTRTISDTNSLETKNILYHMWFSVADIVLTVSNSLKPKCENVETHAESCLGLCQTSIMELFRVNN